MVWCTLCRDIANLSHPLLSPPASLPHNHLPSSSALPYLHCHQAVDGRVLREGGTSAFHLSERKRCEGERRMEYCGWMVDVIRHPKKSNHFDKSMAICGGAFQGVSHGQPSSTCYLPRFVVLYTRLLDCGALAKYKRREVPNDKDGR